ncbi:MAG: FAD-binding oxidoreductase [Dehalococcoidia bacterium]
MGATQLNHYGVTPDAWTAFRLRIKGEIILPGDEGYEASRHVHQLLADKRPAVFVKVRDAADVSRSIHFARRYGLPISVRAGGHGLSGQAIVDDGLVIDMTEFNEIRIDADARTAWAQPGATAGEYADAAQQYGLATPFGDAASVGLGGITLGGGIGFLTRKYGLTIDNLLAVELVTAEGQIVQASATENEDLFWALRGGGGNFGVVTGFQYRLVEAGTVYGGLLALPATTEVIAKYAELSLQAPEGLTSISMVTKAPPLPFLPEEVYGQVIFAVFPIFVGSVEDGEKAMAPLRALAEPIADLVGPMPYPAIYEYMRIAEAPRREKVRMGFFDSLDENFVASILEHAPETPSPMAFFQLRPLGGGQMSKVPVEATAFAHRSANFMVSIIDVWDEAADDEANFSWVDAAWDSIKETRTGVYSNFLQDDTEERLGEAYPVQTMKRLAEIKRRYDPTNFFASNVNIAPAKVSAAA